MNLMLSVLLAEFNSDGSDADVTFTVRIIRNFSQPDMLYRLETVGLLSELGSKSLVLEI